MKIPALVSGFFCPTEKLNKYPEQVLFGGHESGINTFRTVSIFKNELKFYAHYILLNWHF
jgi:hypothetical protein